jgi:predicted metal-dependent phosphoesterase TrpH
MHICKAIEQETGMPAWDAYNRYIAPEMPASSLIGRPSPWQAVECIHDCGGIACIAHPGRIEMSFAEREALIRDLKKFGVDGMEAYYPTHTEEETQYFLALTKELSLLVSGGSDTHYESLERKIGDPFFEPSDALLSKVKVF